MSDKYIFDSAFQRKIVALSLRDPVFARQTQGLVDPEYFESNVHGFLLSIAQDHYNHYEHLPDQASFINIMAQKFNGNAILREELREPALMEYMTLLEYDISNAEYVADQIVPFAQVRALEEALYKSVHVIQQVKDNGRSDDLAKVIQEIQTASQVGLSEDLSGSDFIESAAKRQKYRQDLLDGVVSRRGIPLGIKPIDELLYHGGYGRGEMSLILGPEKSGKSAFCGDFLARAFKQGYNMLGVTLEVGRSIYEDRLDANLTQTDMSNLNRDNQSVVDRLTQLQSNHQVGCIKLHEFPTHSLTPLALVRLIERYRAIGISFDGVVIDSLDLMVADTKGLDERATSNYVYGAARGIAQRYDFALLSPTQLNRAGGNALVAESNMVGTDISRVQLADLVMTINRSPEEAAEEAFRLYFAASRNQKGKFAVKIKSNLSQMTMIEQVLMVDGDPV